MGSHEREHGRLDAAERWGRRAAAAGVREAMYFLGLLLYTQEAQLNWWRCFPTHTAIFLRTSDC